VKERNANFNQRRFDVPISSIELNEENEREEIERK
jgi:hypothetical protein